MPCGVSIPGGAFLHNIHDSPCAQITLGWKGSLLKSGTASHLRDLQDWGRQLSPKEALCSVVLAPKDPQVWLHREAAVALGCATCEGAAARVGFAGAGCARLWDLMERRCLGLGRLVASRSHQDFPCPQVSVPVGSPTNSLDHRCFGKAGDLQTEMSGPQVVQPTARGALQWEEPAYTQGYQHEHRNVLPNRCSTTGQQKGEEQRFLSSFLPAALCDLAAEG